jgi:hypothetical protein
LGDWVCYRLVSEIQIETPNWYGMELLDMVLCVGKLVVNNANHEKQYAEEHVGGKKRSKKITLQK